ncbi:MAG: hypothetical protein H9993_01870, partial [Candidatus Desulfovibrio faecigallinarum]|nr:hypothetical protein [Candidatus Desulfovibrio faecigallinarum]
YVAPGARVPFTMVFQNAPAGVDEYAVKVGDSEIAENAAQAPAQTPAQAQPAQAAPAVPAAPAAPQAQPAPAAPSAR